MRITWHPMSAAIALILLLAGSRTWAAGPSPKGPSLAITVGLGGAQSQESYCPVYLRVTPKPAPGSSASVTITLLGRSEPPWVESLPRTPLYISRFDLRFPPDGRTLSVPVLLREDAERLRVELQTPAGRLARTVDLEGSRRQLALVLSGRREQLTALGDAADAVFVAPADLPDDWRSYDAVSHIVLDYFDLSQLPPDVLAAMHQAITWGVGLFVTGPGLAINAGSPLLGPLADLRIAGFAPPRAPQDLQSWLFWGAPDAQGMQPLPLLRLQGADPAAVMLGSADQPLLLRASFLRSSVVACAFDPATLAWDQSDAGYQARVASWARLLYAGDSAEARDFSSPEVVDSLVPREARIQGALWPIVILLSVFLLALGPVNFLVIRRARRREWLLLTVPAAVLAFLLAAVLVFRGALPRQNVLCVETALQAAVGRPEAVQATYFGLLPRGQGPQSVALDPSAKLQPPPPGTDDYGSLIGLEARPISHAEQPGASILLDGIWQRPRAMRFLAAAWTTEVTPPQAEARDEDDALLGAFTNTFGEPLEDVSVIVRWRRLSLGTVQPGETKSFRLPLGPADRFELPGGSAIAYNSPAAWLHADPDCRFASAGWFDACTSCGPRLTSGGPEAAFLLEQIARAGRIFRQPVILGWSRRESPVASPGADRRDRRLVMVSVPLTALSGERVSLPAGLSFPDPQFVGPYLRESQSRGGRDAAAFVFQLPLVSADFADCELTLHAFATTPRWAARRAGVPLRLLNWEERSWEEVAKPVLGEAEVEIDRAGRFIKQPEGWVAVALEREEESFDEEFEENMMLYQNPWQAQLTYLDLSLQGRLR